MFRLLVLNPAILFLLLYVHNLVKLASGVQVTESSIFWSAAFSSLCWSLFYYECLPKDKK